MSAFLLRFEASYLAKMRGYPHFSLWISIALAMTYHFHLVLNWHKTLCIWKAPSLSETIYDIITFLVCIIQKHYTVMSIKQKGIFQKGNVILLYFKKPFK